MDPNEQKLWQEAAQFLKRNPQPNLSPQMLVQLILELAELLQQTKGYQPAQALQIARQEYLTQQAPAQPTQGQPSLWEMLPQAQ